LGRHHRRADAYAARVIGIHVNLLAVRRDPSVVKDSTPEERIFLDQLSLWLNEGTGSAISGFKALARKP
jgi:hypothetical protein